MERLVDMESLQGIAGDSEQRIFVDFDHTLLAANSTELFLSCCRPVFAVSILLAVVRENFLWQYASLDKWVRVRDYLSVVLCVVLMPWNILIWRRLGPRLFKENENREVASALGHIQKERVTIVSFGIAPLIRQALYRSAWAECECIAVPLFGRPQNLFRSKLEMVRQHFSETVLREAAFITDSESDMDLLDYVRDPVLIKPAGELRAAEKGMYMPLRYTWTAKYPKGYIFNQFICVDLMILVLATQPWPILLPNILLISILSWSSLICVYEIGYFENDHMAARNEKTPTITDRILQFRNLSLERHAWVWAIILGLLAIASEPPGPPIRTAGAWACVLLLTRLVFWVYNRTPEKNRIFLYGPLQLLKYFGPLVLLSASAAGAALLMSQVMAMWMTYVVYRLSGRAGAVPRNQMRLTIFIILFAAYQLTNIGHETKSGIVCLSVITLWCMWRAIPWQIRRIALAPIRKASRFMTNSLVFLLGTMASGGKS